MDELTRRAGELASRAAASGQRLMLGIAGAPGAGKSTVAEALAAALGPRIAACVPMDGFHIADAVLRAAGLRERKGAPDTFDADGYASVLHRLRRAEATVYAPRFDRDREDSVAAAIAVDPAVPLVITEGNYLLLWPQVRAQLDEVWYLDPPRDRRLERLTARHVRHGKAPEQAIRWAREVDEANAVLIESRKHTADLLITQW